MSASASTVSPPPPRSPGRSSSSAMATTPPTVTVDTRHRSRPSFAIAYSRPPPASTSSVSPSSSTGPSASHPPNSNTSSTSTSHAHPSIPVAQASKPFVAPAHPQSHHLHMLPPREKTTRTLILDHTAWLHGRTRFAQGRSELGMKVRFKSAGETADTLGVRAPDMGGRPGFYIASGSGSGRANPFGDPLEIELASSDEEEDNEGRESDAEMVWALRYGRRSRERQTKGIDGKKLSAEDRSERMDVDESDFGCDTDGELSTTQSSPSRSRDSSVAPSLAARAIGMEKVLHAMLTQPPSSPPRSLSPPPYALHSAHANSQHYRAPPSTQATSPAQAMGANAKSSRLLPNSLRLRLALLTLVNDLFERQPPPASDESPKYDAPSIRPQTTGPFANTAETSKTTNTQSPPGSPTLLPPPSIPPPDTLPPSLGPLAQVSSQPFNILPTLPSFQTLTLPSSSASGSTSAISPSSWTGSTSNVSPSSGFGGGSADKQSSTQPRRPPPPLFTWTRPSTGPTSPSSPVLASPRSDTSFGGPSTDKPIERLSVSSPTSFSRLSGPLSAAPRSLPTSWGGGTARYHRSSSKSAGSSTAHGLTKRAIGRVKELYSAGCYATPGTVQTNSYRSDVRTYGTGTPPIPAAGYPIKKLKTLCPRHLAEQCGICVSGVVSHSGPSTRIGAGLLKMEGGLLTSAVRGDDKKSASVLADMIPRFLRLSALVAMELGREASGEEIDMAEAHAPDKPDAASTDSSPSTRSSLHAQPTCEWYALLCGLLTRAVLEGYVARAWQGSEYVEVLLGIGLGIKGVGTRKSSTAFGGGSAEAPPLGATIEEEDAGEFEPDEMPGLVEACKVLFNGLVLDASASGGREKATQAVEEEYVVEMQERMSEFFTIPHTTPDLATHLTQLSAEYPAEPVERAALRFCEAVAKWRGKPELETYKKISTLRLRTKSQSSTPGAFSALTSTPTPVPRRPLIDRYFRIPLSPSRKPAEAHRTLKRQRSVDEEEREPKKEKVEPVDVDLSKSEDGDPEAMQEWVGPYGV